MQHQVFSVKFSHQSDYMGAFKCSQYIKMCQRSQSLQSNFSQFELKRFSSDDQRFCSSLFLLQDCFYFSKRPKTNANLSMKEQHPCNEITSRVTNIYWLTSSMVFMHTLILALHQFTTLIVFFKNLVLDKTPS